MTFYFRALPILYYDPDTGDVTSPVDDNGTSNFNKCSFINIDFLLLAEFFITVTMHKLDSSTELNDMEVD